MFTLPNLTVRDTRVLELQYKLIHRCHATKSIICKWDQTVNPICPICNSKANILHDFYSCPEIQTFWQNIYNMLIQNLEEKLLVPLSMEVVLFGKYRGIKYDILNHAVLYAKYFIHKQKVQQKHVLFNQFFTYYKRILDIEKERYIFLDRRDAFDKRFGTLVKALQMP